MFLQSQIKGLEGWHGERCEDSARVSVLVQSDAIYRWCWTILIFWRHHPVLDATFIVGNSSVANFNHNHSHSFAFYEMTPPSIASSGVG